MLEVHRRGYYGIVDHRVADNLAGSRTANERGFFEVAAQFIHPLSRP